MIKVFKHSLALAQSWSTWVIPPICLHCGETCTDTARPALCEACQELQWQSTRCGRCGARCHPSETTKKRCQHCKRTPLVYQSMFTIGPYRNFLRLSILKVKYQQSPLALGCCQDLSLTFPSPPHLDMVVSYVPSHQKRMRQRGCFEQHLPKMIYPWLKKHDLVIQPLLKKNEFHKAQVELNGEQRRKAVYGSYDYIGPSSAPETVWLFDDVITTGATIHAAAHALKEAGVKNIHCFAFAWSSKE